MQHTIEFYGDYACFTRPETKVERYSYPCPTPSAARNMFDAIYWHPGMYWQIDKIELLNKVAYTTIRRNEVKGKISVTNVKVWMNNNKKIKPFYADATGGDTGRTQRQTIAIVNPRYRITGQAILKKEYNGDKEQCIKDYAKCNAIFKRRAIKGSPYRQPFFGCKEFVAEYDYIEDFDNIQQPVDSTIKVGTMLYDVFDLSKNTNNHSDCYVTFFNAMIENGVLIVPPFNSTKVIKPELEQEHATCN